MSTTTTTITPSGVQIIRDLPFGEALVGYGTSDVRSRPLLLNVYLPPEGIETQSRPALVLAHGGAYHRGSKDTDEFEQDGSHNTPVPEYAERYAAKGLVTFSVGYRLTQEGLPPQASPIRRNRGAVVRGRIDYVRQLLGLPPATDDELLNGVEGAIDDLVTAFRFVQRNAPRWQIDPARIVLGGFSAGAFSSVYAAYALGVPAAGVISLSGGIETEDADFYLQPNRSQAPVLLVSSEFDLPGIRERTLTLAAAAKRAGVGYRSYFVPGKPHFYDRETLVQLEENRLSEQAQTQSLRLEAVIDEFLHDTVGTPIPA